ncbi:MAG TPA: hypothetical protein VMU06_20685 [Stellaceae bacterium]|nr:hypothetical protein [Stellaceae bacterium]
MSDQLWLIRLGPNDVQHLGEARNAAGEMSVIIAANPHFDPASHELRFDGSDVTVLNIGTSLDTLVVGVRRERGAVAAQRERYTAEQRAAAVFGPGDREFLDAAAQHLAGRPREAAEHLLARLRATCAGDLRKGRRLEFANRPDNAWHFAIQPRSQSLAVTVRGSPERFAGSPFHLRPFRGRLTRFVIDRPEEVEEAARIIRNAERSEERRRSGTPAGVIGCRS